MAFSTTTKRFLRRRPWIRPFLWLLVTLCSMYFIRHRLFKVISVTWTQIIQRLLGYWWRTVGWALMLAAHLCRALAATYAFYLLIVWVIGPIAGIASDVFMDQLLLALSKPPPEIVEFSHTDSNGEMRTYRVNYDDIPNFQASILALYEERMRHLREEEERKRRQWTQPKGKKRGKRRK